ncbi:hypothetical protein CL614_02360 [archaeon]|nr:hypothetical protein [archaeon]
MSSNVRFMEAITSGFDFVNNSKNFLFVFIWSLIQIILVGVPTILISSSLLTTVTSGTSYISVLISYLPLIIIGVVVYLVEILFTGALIYRYKTEKSLSVSIKFALNKYHRLLGINLIFILFLIIAGLCVLLGVYLIFFVGSYVIITIVGAMLILIGIIVGIMILLIFPVFMDQEVILTDNSVIQIAKNLWAIFKKEWINILIIAIIVVIFWFFITIFFSVVPNAIVSVVALFNIVPPSIYIILTIITTVIAVIGTTIIKLMMIGSFTHVYLQIKKVKVR